MKKNERKAIVKAATEELIANVGVVNFSIKEVSRITGIVEPMIFRDFTTTKNLFYECYNDFDDELAKFYDTIQIPPFTDQKQYASLLNYFWFSYMNFLIRSSYKTVFYYEFRFNHRKKFQGVGEERPASADAIIARLNHALHINDERQAAMMWLFVESSSLYFASQVICGRMENHPDVFELIRQLIFNGAMSVITGE